MSHDSERPKGLVTRLVALCVDQRLLVLLITALLVLWGVRVAPFDWNVSWLGSDPVPVDAIPDIGENQQIVFTEWSGRSPQDVEDQITYPLTTTLLGVPGVKTVRSFSYFGFSSIYVIFHDDVEFYWSRSRLLERLSALPAGTLPDDAHPVLGPDATALGQVFWYTLEGRDNDGNPAGGWGLQELRTIQDWTVRFALQSVEGVAEVSSVGGYVQEYQVDVDPDAMRAYGVSLKDVFHSVRQSNVDVGARTIEINRAEYVIRGVGYIQSTSDIEEAVVRQRDNVPVRIRDVATVNLGPAQRRGALDKGGTEAVGGVVVARFGENPLAVIDRVKARIGEISPGLPAKDLADGRTSKIQIVPFYDRTQLIHETLETLNTALIDELLVTAMVMILMLRNLRSAALVAGLLPLAILFTFVAMKQFGVDANVVALAGIAIAIGTMADMGIVMSESMVRRLKSKRPDESTRKAILEAAADVGPAVLTAIATTVVSFLPVFALEAAEGKLFRPLAFTKTFALITSALTALLILPPLAMLIFGRKEKTGRSKVRSSGLWLILAVLAFTFSLWYVGVLLVVVGLYRLFSDQLPASVQENVRRWLPYLLVLILAWILASHWQPLGVTAPVILHFLFVAVILGVLIWGFFLLLRYYERTLRWCLANRRTFLAIPSTLIILGLTMWLGADRLLGWLPDALKKNSVYSSISHTFPGIGREFMPSLDEGSFLYMPTTMPHASIGEVLDILQHQDRAFANIPEVDVVVGKLGRVESALDPAPISMIETVIHYKPEFIYNDDGEPVRQWRDHIRSPDDIWDEIVASGQLVGTTSAPKLQPIETRLIMLQSGMRAPMGVKVRGPDLETVEQVALQIEGLLKQVPAINAATVIADRIVGKPYLEIDIDREAIARFGLHVQDVQDVIEAAIGGKRLTTTVEGRERYGVRVRYPRERRQTFEDLARILVTTSDGKQLPLGDLAQIHFVRGPMVIKSENTFLTGYVTFDSHPGHAEVDVVNQAQDYLNDALSRGNLSLPGGVSYVFAGSYEQQVHAEQRLAIILPVTLVIIFMLLYLLLRDVSTSLIVFSGVAVAWTGGFIMLWLYGQDWFLNVSLFDWDLRELMGVKPYNLSIAVWVGFLALFGIATDDGVLISSYLSRLHRERKPTTYAELTEVVVAAGNRRIRPALMTVATTILALLPVLTSTGRGSDLLVPMAIPSFGGMVIALITVFTVPVLYAVVAERRLETNVEVV